MATTGSVFEIILRWSLDRPQWQRDALRRIVANGTLDADDLGELALLCKKGCGSPGIDATVVPLSADHVPGAAAAGETVALTSIRDVVGVNKLAPGQELPFRVDGITVVYGDNGVGKSGYARILKRACRSRFPGRILPNAFETVAAAGSATIGCLVGGSAVPAVVWTDAVSPHPTLASISVFDRDCGLVHVRERNEVAFRPFGLDIPDELAGACQSLKTTLGAEQAALERCRDEAFAKPAFGAATVAGGFLGSLSPATDLAALDQLAVLSDDERARLRRLDTDLAREPVRASAEQTELARSLKRLADDVGKVMLATDDATLERLVTLAGEARAQRGAATLAAERAFGGTALRGVGEATWRALWDAARHYSEHVAYVDHGFPRTDGDALCVLCHQPISAEAGDLKVSFEDFVKADSERQARRAETAYEDAAGNLAGVSIRMSGFALGRRLGITHPEVAAALRRDLATARLRRWTCLKAIRDGRIMAPRQASDGIVSMLTRAAADTEAYAAELLAAVDPAGRARLAAERDELRDRDLLATLLPKARIEVERLSSMAVIKACLAETTTNAITALGNTIADEVITPKVRDRFQEEIQKLAARRVRVDIVRSGGRLGSPHYQVRLFANERAKVGEILSEGEQTCVALAAFLTELATAAHGSTLVFDDPVSSLDHLWRRKVAERLVEEGGVRQIVVFTHDLVFVNDLHVLADDGHVPISLVSLSHTSAGAGIVSTGLPWVGAKVRQRLDTLAKEARAARILYDAQEDEEYGIAVSRIYSKLRSTWERALEEVAFCGVINRHRDYIATKDLLKVTTLTAADVEAFAAGFKRCCDQTESHDPAPGRNAAPPIPEELLKAVQDLSDWVERVREQQKAVA
ncbi:AAA family ATPase [Methylobacterium sp. J-088]|uniref:AAA family ATPase n=1 Tax=Methylobacterium sp. J-088 TaxID=2836664 RepID=UPI001FBBFBF0|nr:AAA family ATPase [Methylobacterium sp. J-088]MCJ2065981.1 AAA family ATPase [Methylobacterium sp. J-088]